MSDYTPGDMPVPIGSLVEYEDKPGLCKILDHSDPNDHPHRNSLPNDLSPYYPDGVAYTLWMADVPVGMDNSWAGTWWVRRGSFTVTREGTND